MLSIHAQHCTELFLGCTHLQVKDANDLNLVSFTAIIIGFPDSNKIMLSCLSSAVVLPQTVLLRVVTGSVKSIPLSDTAVRWIAWLRLHSVTHTFLIPLFMISPPGLARSYSTTLSYVSSAFTW